MSTRAITVAALLLLAGPGGAAQAKPLTRAEMKAFFKKACRYWALEQKGEADQAKKILDQVSPYEAKSWKGLRQVFTRPFQGPHRFKKSKRGPLRHPPTGLEDCWYVVRAPGGHSRRKTFPLVIALHGGSRGVGNPEQAISLFGAPFQKRCIIAAPKVPPNAVFAEAISRRFVQEIIWEVGMDYSVDWDRIYCVGHSLGGVGAWYMPVMTTDLFAAGAPAAGNPPVILDYEMLYNIPMYVVHGATDIQVTPDADREAAAKVKAIPAAHKRPGWFVYREITTRDTRGHGLPAPVVQDMARFVMKFRREFAPRRVIVVSPTVENQGKKVEFHGRSHWLRIDGTAHETRADATLEKNTIRITLSGAVRSLTIYVSDDMLDMSKPVRVYVNERLLHDKMVPRSAPFLLQHIEETRDRGRVYANRIVVSES